MSGQRPTKRLVDRLDPNDGEQIVWDSEVPGFGVRVRPGGSKTFIAQYRAGGGRSGTNRRYTIARFGKMTVEEARDEAKRIVGSVAHGEDPAADRAVKRREMTVAELIEVFAAEGTDQMKERNRRYMLARLQHHVVPILGRKKISDVRVADVEQFMPEVKAGRTAKDEMGPNARSRIIVRGGAGAALKGVRDLSAVLTFAVRRELLLSNPCSAVKKPADGKRTRFLSLEEVQRLGAALDAFEVEGMSPKALKIMRLWAMTGCRRDEIAGLNWSEVDFGRACLRLEHTKSGKSVRPLAGAAIALLQGITRDPASKFVFPSEDGVLITRAPSAFGRGS